MVTGHTNTDRIGVTLLWLSGAFALLSAIIAATGGYTLHVGAWRLSLHAVLRPVVAALGFGVCAVFALRRDGVEHALDPLERALPRIAWPMAVIFAAVIGAGAFVGGAQLAGGADSSGYVSEARLWREAGIRDLTRLQRETPLARDLTLANRQYAFTPVGYQPVGPGLIVPGYPPGLPLHLALFAWVAGDSMQFLVVPLCAAGVVMVAFLIGRRLGGPDVALIAAAAAGGSPILIYQAVQPMSDAVAAFWCSLGVLLLLSRSVAMWVLAGIACAIACVVRPNLFAMMPILVALAWWWHGVGIRTAPRLAAACVPVGLAAIWFVYFQRSLYGAASTTGYGEMSTLFAFANVWPNIGRYARWAVYVQSAMLFVTIAAPLAIRFGWITPEIDRRQAERVAWAALIFFACLQVFYLLYLVFDDWVFFRFLLPALPWLLALQAVVLAAATTRFVPSPYRGMAIILLAILVGSWGVGRARAVGAFRLQDSEQRYLEVATFARGLPPNSVFVTLQHSGSLWYHDHANVLRWDWLDAGEADTAMTTLTRAGRPVYVVLENWEEPRFRERFANTQFANSLKTPVFSAGIPTEIVVHVYTVTAPTTAAVVQ